MRIIISAERGQITRLSLEGKQLVRQPEQVTLAGQPLDEQISLQQDPHSHVDNPLTTRRPSGNGARKSV